MEAGGGIVLVLARFAGAACSNRSTSPVKSSSLWLWSWEDTLSYAASRVRASGHDRHRPDDGKYRSRHGHVRNHPRTPGLPFGAVDEILNAVLFVLLGLELMIL